MHVKLNFMLNVSRKIVIRLFQFKILDYRGRFELQSRNITQAGLIRTDDENWVTIKQSLIYKYKLVNTVFEEEFHNK